MSLSIAKYNILLIFLVLPIAIYSHGRSEENGSSKKILSDGSLEKSVTKLAVTKEYETGNRAGFFDLISQDIPTYHPLVIHFPVVLLILALPFYIIGFVYKRIDFKRFALLLCGAGFIGSVAAAFVFHPHTEGLSGPVHELLEYHEHFAYATVILSGLSLLTGIIAFALKFSKRALEYFLLVLMLFSLIGVSITGHIGALLVYRHEIGPGGKYLEKNTDH